jgi:hypothetical protein
LFGPVLAYSWVVPYKKKDNWKDKIPKGCAKGESKGSSEGIAVVNKCLEEHVKQFVLVLAAPKGFYR